MPGWRRSRRESRKRRADLCYLDAEAASRPRMRAAQSGARSTTIRYRDPDPAAAQILVLESSRCLVFLLEVNGRELTEL